MKNEINFKKQFDSYYLDGYNGWMMNIKSSHKYRFKWAFYNMLKYKKNINNSLEIACASGDFTDFLIKHCHSILELNCIDICQTAINICKERIKCGNVNFQVEGLPNLNFESDYFNSIWCMDVIYYLDIKQRYESVREINRILDKDGIALFMIPYNIRDSSSVRRCVSKYMVIIDEKYNYNRLWGDFTVYLEKKYKKYKKKKGIFWLLLSKICIRLMKSMLLMNIIHGINSIFFKNRISHYMIIAKKNY